MTHNKKYHLEAMKLLGLDTDKHSYESCVSHLIYTVNQLQKQVELTNKEVFEQELKRVLKPTN